MKVRTRFAPSPTGKLHIGGARTALFNFAFAAVSKGKFVLRIEDTDEKRSKEESIAFLIKDLKWLKIKWDEGPDIGGPAASYKQSERKAIYDKQIDILRKKNMAYEKDGAIYFKMPKQNVVLKDSILGEITLKADQCEDFVIRKSTGMPSFYFAVTVDDEDMKITHVLRGQEHINTAFRQMALQKALECTYPLYMGHIPLILDTGGKKLSKRNNDSSVFVSDFREQGYIPEALINYISLLGWSQKNHNEVFDIDFLCSNFNISSIGKSNAKFDYKKLLNFNSFYLRVMSLGTFAHQVGEHAQKYNKQILDKFINSTILSDVIGAYYQRSKLLSEPIVAGIFFLDAPKHYDKKAVDNFVSRNNNEGLKILKNIYTILECLDIWDRGQMQSIIAAYSEINKVPMKKIAQPIRIALAGNIISPPIDHTLEILGRKESLTRIDNFINAHKKDIS